MSSLICKSKKVLNFPLIPGNTHWRRLIMNNLLTVCRTFLIIIFLISGAFIINLNAQSSKTTDPLISGTQYFIAPDGNDSNPGTAQQPWKTLDKANQVLQPGDIITLRDGTYEGIISPVNDGRNANKVITYRSEKRYGAILTGQENSNYIINLSGRRFITIEGFKMLPARGGFGYIKGCDHIILQNCHMEHSSMVYCPLEFIDGDYNRLLYNTMSHVIQRTTDSKIHGDGCHFINSSYNLIEGNDFAKIGHSPLRIWSTTPHKANYNVIRGNCFHNGWGRNFEMFNLDRSLFECNIITDAFNGASSADSRGKVFLTDGIFRNCLIYDNWDNPLASNSYIDKPTTGDVPLELKNSRIYNNTFANNPSYLWSFGGSGEKPPIASNIFMNNLFYRNDFVGDNVTFMMSSTGVADDNLFHNNLFFGEKPNQAVINILGKRYTSKQLNEELSKRCQGNIDSDPEFISNQNRCFALGDGSPALNTGKYLSTALGSGSGKVIPVSDARCFFDGFGIEGEKGDIIVIGAKKAMARVVKADIEKNELTLDRKVRWKANDPVSLPYSGTAPDVGAFQHGNTGILMVVPYAQPAITGIGQPVIFTALISGSRGEANLEWNFGDGTISGEKAPQHVYKDFGDYTVRLRCTDASGAIVNSIFFVRVERTVDPKEPLMQTGFEEEDFEEWGHLWDRGPVRESKTYYPEARNDGKGQCMCVSTEGNNSTLATNVKMRIWDIDKYPFVHFSYRIPKGVPVGVWLDTWPSENHPVHICIGGSPANSAGAYPDLDSYKLVDDGQWHDIEIDVRKIRQIVPDIKLLKVFGFSTNSKSLEGQKFWFDDFVIKP